MPFSFLYRGKPVTSTLSIETNRIMRANILLLFGLFVAISSAQITTDFSSLTARPVTGSTLNSVTNGGSWYLNTGRNTAFEIQLYKRIHRLVLLIFWLRRRAPKNDSEPTTCCPSAKNLDIITGTESLPFSGSLLHSSSSLHPLPFETSKSL